MASVRCYGSNYFGQLGLGETAQKGTVQQYTWSTAVLPFKCDSILDIQCGGHFTVVLDEDGCVYFAGQLNNFVYPSFQFVDTSLPIKCIQVACGRKHIVILLQGGYVLSWGAGYCGQLGLGDDSSWDYPRLVYSLDPSKLAGVYFHFPSICALIVHCMRRSSDSRVLWRVPQRCSSGDRCAIHVGEQSMQSMWCNRQDG